MSKDIEKLIKNADFSAGSNHKEELREQLFGGNSAKIVKFQTNRELNEDELEMISAAGMIEEQYLDKMGKEKRQRTEN